MLHRLLCHGCLLLVFCNRLAGVDAHMQGEKWRAAFLRVAAAAGILVHQGSDPQPEAVVQAVMDLKRSEEQLQVSVQHLPTAAA